jgi:hypothetical protein
MQRPDDSSLTPGQLARVRKEAERALRESGALGVFPTPVDQIMAVARVAEVKEDVLNPGFVAKLRAKAEQAGQVVRRALSKVLGLFHASEGLVFLNQSLMAVKKRFVGFHEAGHGFLPWQRPMYAIVEDCEKALGERPSGPLEHHDHPSGQRTRISVGHRRRCFRLQDQSQQATLPEVSGFPFVRNGDGGTI